MAHQATIAARAYQLWEAAGAPYGRSEEFWHEAQRQLEQHGESGPASAMVDESLKETFPASDPAATAVSTEPPVNADAKWEAAGIERTGAAARVR